MFDRRIRRVCIEAPGALKADLGVFRKYKKKKNIYTKYFMSGYMEITEPALNDMKPF
jgi:hypothetical protein